MAFPDHTDDELRVAIVLAGFVGEDYWTMDGWNQANLLEEARKILEDAGVSSFEKLGRDLPLGGHN